MTLLKETVKITLAFALLAALVPLLVFAGKDKQRSEPAAAKTTGTAVKVLYEKSGKTVSYDETEFIALSLMAQIPRSYEDEAIMAQAVLVRTYLERRRNSGESLKGGALVSDDRTRFQTFFSKAQAKKLFGTDFNSAFKRFCKLAQSTEGELLEYEGEPVLPAYHAVSCGLTRSAKDAWGEDIAYLVSVESKADKNSPDFSHKITLTDSELKKKLEKAFGDLGSENEKGKSLLEIECDKNGFIKSAEIFGSEVSGGELCRALGLDSPCVEVSRKSGKVTFKVKGVGHLVGLSLYGANEMARAGKTHKEILEYYFKGASLETN